MELPEERNEVKDDLIDEVNKLVESKEEKEDDEAVEDRWECLRCGENEIYEERGREPYECPSCERKGPFEALEGPFQFFDDNGFVAKKLADEIEENYHFATHRDTEELYVYEGGIYVPYGESVVREYCRKRLGEKAKRTYVNETVEHIRETNYVDSEDFNRHKKFIHCKNTLFDVQEILELDKEPEEIDMSDIIAAKREFTPKIISTVKINADPSGRGEPEKIVDFLKDVVGENQVPLIQELFGYCLYKDYPIAKAFMLRGEGSNGKTTLLNLLKKFLGDKNIANPSLQDLLNNRFAKADLFGKLANVHADIPRKELKDTGTFKMLTGEDTIRAEKKHKDAFTFKNYAKLIYSANQLPRTKDTTDAFFRRWVIIDFPYKFTDNPDDEHKDKDPNILDKIVTQEQLNELFTWSIKGLKRLFDQEHFTETESREEVEERWMMQTSNLQAFFNRALRYDGQSRVIKDELFRVYEQWAKDNDVKPKDRSVIGRKIMSKFPRIEKKRPKINGKQRRVYSGIRFKKEFKEEYGDKLKVFSEKENTPQKEYMSKFKEAIPQEGWSKGRCVRRLKEFGCSDPEDTLSNLVDDGKLIKQADISDENNSESIYKPNFS